VGTAGMQPPPEIEIKAQIL